MDESPIRSRIEVLTREIESIKKEERDYQNMKYHSSADIMAEASRNLRLSNIQSELEQIQKRDGP